MKNLVKDPSELNVLDDKNPKIPYRSEYAKNILFEEICNNVIHKKKNIEEIIMGYI